MKHMHVNTSNTSRFLAALDALDRRGAGEACLLVVDGEPGLGKTKAVEWWATQTGSLFVRAKAQWTPAWALRELLQVVGVPPEHSFERMYRQVLTSVARRRDEAVREGAAYGLVIDEIDHVARNTKLLETIRDISDMLEIPTILVGMARVRHTLTRSPQIASRIGQYVDFQSATLEDVRRLIDGLCEVPVADDLAEYLHRVSRGLTREIKEGIASIERVGRRLKGAPVTCAAMGSEVLLNDRSTGRPIRVLA